MRINKKSNSKNSKGIKKGKNIRKDKVPEYFGKDLLAISNWNLITIKKFNKYISKYNLIPNYKKLAYSMIKFDEMYRPIIKGGKYVDVFGTTALSNEYRRMMRAKIFANKKDLIQSYDKKSGRRLVVTSTGHKIFYQGIPLAKLRKEKWNGYWTVAMYDIPERRVHLRNYIRKKLIRLGFGCPQKSVYVTPLPIEKEIKDLVEKEKLEHYLWVLRAKNILGMSNKAVAKRSWNLGEINDLYDKLLRVLIKIKKRKKKTKLLLEDWKLYFMAVNASDPYLPIELLPNDWKGIVCERKFLKLGPLGVLKALFVP